MHRSEYWFFIAICVIHACCNPRISQQHSVESNREPKIDKERIEVKTSQAPVSFHPEIQSVFQSLVREVPDSSLMATRYVSFFGTGHGQNGKDWKANTAWCFAPKDPYPHFRFRITSGGFAKNPKGHLRLRNGFIGNGQESGRIKKATLRIFETRFIGDYEIAEPIINQSIELGLPDTSEPAMAPVAIPLRYPARPELGYVWSTALMGVLQINEVYAGQDLQIPVCLAEINLLSEDDLARDDVRWEHDSP
ncbi:MAG: hypothetical protein HS115_06955 [Spirochaetales bacterium]|nr:hypothetical protein [Spirochaetales bacterium]